MSFPGSFSSQLAAIMEALLKAAVAEVTALVEDGAAELRLELRDRDREIRDRDREIHDRDREILEKEREIHDRDREIREKEREIHDRDREILELRAAVELLRAREEAALSSVPGEEQKESCLMWTKEEEEDSEPVVKCEPTEEFTTEAPEPHESLWPPPPLPPPPPLAPTAAAVCTYEQTCAEAEHEILSEGCHSYNTHLTATKDAFSPFEQEQVEPQSLPLDALLNINQEQFYTSQQTGFSLMPPIEQVQDNFRSKNKRMDFNAKRLINYTGTDSRTGFRCDQCGKIFTAKLRLITHQSVHTGEKPFSCKKCGKRFSRRDNCVRHERSDGCHNHLNNSSLDFGLSGRRFGNSRGRDMFGVEQRRAKTWKLENICPYCGKCFSGASQLERHKRIHTGEKPFKCETCGRCFSQNCSLKEHRKIHNRNAQPAPAQTQASVPNNESAHTASLTPEETDLTTPNTVPPKTEGIPPSTVHIKTENLTP